jgi:hypothetical protein
VTAPQGAINTWQCDTCRGILVAVHTDEGTTPMFLGCRAEVGCKGTMVSAGYPSSPIPDYIVKKLAWHWHKASTTQMKAYKRNDPAMYQHLQMGGLLLDRLPVEAQG